MRDQADESVPAVRDDERVTGARVGVTGTVTVNRTGNGSAHGNGMSCHLARGKLFRSFWVNPLPGRGRAP
ncbi:hypothetical protein GCM10009755_21640 [Brevibacterium samyangense]|uniref:Uncharacterized protein n=1 Tax=Brevibacterium samyangense TaxID=366888 RepID=A0ABP5F0D9_9MICO